jgi:hypothetical protein
VTKTTAYVLIAAALAAGVLLGVFVCRGEDEGERLRGTRGVVRPSDLVDDGKPGWPHVDCSGTPAALLLDEIQMLAEGAFQVQLLGPQQYVHLTNLVNQCALSQRPDAAEHCLPLVQARQAALEGNWVLCIEQMEHPN